MDPYSTPYVSIVPRIIPSQGSLKKIPMNDDGLQYIDTRPSSYVSPSNMTNNSTNFRPLSTRAQSFSNDINPQEASWPNQSNLIDGSTKGRIKGRIHHEPLKDASGDNNSPNSYLNYAYAPGYDRPHENPKGNSPMNNLGCVKTLIIVFGTIISLFSITALAISIYSLIRITT